MAETVFQRIVRIVTHLDHAILHPKSVPEIIPCFIAGDLWCPSGQILPVKELNPLFPCCFLLVAGGQHQDHCNETS